MPAVSRTSSCASDPQRVSVCVFINVCVCLWAVCLREKVKGSVSERVPISPMMLCHLPCLCVCARVVCARPCGCASICECRLPTGSRVVET